MKKIYAFIAILLPLFSFAQLPQVNQPGITSPSQTVYLAPNGSDSNSGTAASPLKTFYAALNLINWGTPFVNGGNAYAEVVLLPGDYYPAANTGFVQLENQWRQYNFILNTWVYKNVSIRGSGTVHIHGDSLVTGNQMIFMMGSHVKISNLYISNCPLHGIFMQGSEITHHSDVLVDSVTVDSASGFGIFFSGYDRVLAQNCTVKYTCRQNEFELNNTCQWPSGLRADNCNHVSFFRNNVHHNWGEGINTSYARYVDVKDNYAYDNYSVNIYCHSASCAMYRYNMVYNADSLWWRYCYSSNGKSADGISVANELNCPNACASSYGCGANIGCCAYRDYNNLIFYVPVTYFQTDSIYIYNNILLEAGIIIWDASSNALNHAYMNHLHVEHNTVIGKSGASLASKQPLALTLNLPTIHFEGLNIRNNIFTIDNTISNANDFLTYVPGGTCNPNWESQISFSGNLWHSVPATPNISFASDQASASAPLHATISDTADLIPSPAHPELVMTDVPVSYITDDYYHNPRMSNTNAGAIEYNTSLSANSMNTNPAQAAVYPNPAGDYFSLRFPHANENWLCEIREAESGRVMSKQNISSNSQSFSTASWPNGVYIIRVRNINGEQNLKLVLCR